METQGRTRRLRARIEVLCKAIHADRLVHAAPTIESLEQRAMLSAQLPDRVSPLHPLANEPFIGAAQYGPSVHSIPAELVGRVTDEYWGLVQEALLARSTDLPNTGVRLSLPSLSRVSTAGAVDSYVHVSEWQDSTLSTIGRIPGCLIQSANRSMRVIEAWIPPDAVQQVLKVEGVGYIDLPALPVVDNVGAAGTDGDAILRADLVRQRFAANNIDGTGLRIGVISDGASNRAYSQTTGDLPAVINMDPNHPGYGDEGTAMLEIVHDLAPGAELYFSGPNSALAMIDAIQWMVDPQQHVDVIVDDLNFFDEPFFADGAVAAAVTDGVNNHGVVYVTSAGNAGTAEGMYGRSHYQHAFVDSGSGYHDFLEGAQVDISKDMQVDAHSTINVQLQWSDPFGASANDYNLFLYNANLSLILAQSTFPQLGTQDPYEHLSWTNPDDLGTLGGSYTGADGINNLGQVVGSSSRFPGDRSKHAFRTAPNQPINPGTDDLGTLGGAYSYALGINDLGQVVGWSETASGEMHAFRTGPNRPINPATDDLGTLGGSSSGAYGINNLGQVAGSSSMPGQVPIAHAFRTAANRASSP